MNDLPFFVPPETERLRFRIWQQADVDQFHAVCSEPEVMKFVGDGHCWPRHETQGFIDRARDTLRLHGYCQWPLIDRRDASLIGFCGFANAEFGPEVGWRLAPSHWGKGLATEAAHNVIQHGFHTLGFQHLFATVQVENAASVRIIKKLGMKRIKLFSRVGREMALYSLDCESWAQSVGHEGTSSQEK